MKILGFGRYAISVGVAVAMLWGCGGSQPPIGAPVAMPQSRTVATHAERGRSWVLPQAQKSVLIYAGGFYGNVYVYDYDTGKHVGTLKTNSDGMCVDAKGDVYVTQMGGTTVEYAHGGTKVLKTFNSGGVPAGCSVDASNDLAVTSASPAYVTVFARGDPNKGTSYSDSACESLVRMGYDDAGNLMGQGGNSDYITVCALLAGSQSETTLSKQGFIIHAPGATMWDGKYITLVDQDAENKSETGVVAASLSGSALVSHGETILSDPCSGGPADVSAPFFVGTKNTPISDRRAKVAIGVNSVCEAHGKYLIEFWHYPSGGNPFKTYKEKTPLGGPIVSIER
jgi:hypothetical protein